MSGDTQRAILAELAAGMQEITRLVGLDRESGEIGPTVERVAALVAAGLLAAPAAQPDGQSCRHGVDPRRGNPCYVCAAQPAQFTEAFEPRVPPAAHASPAAPADDEATPTMRTLHVTATRDIPEGHTDQRVRYEYEGDSWEAWFIAFGKGQNGEEAYLMRDNGERWVVMADNITQVDSTAALAALREEKQQ